ncbi:hypothetical protein [Winogradskyella sp. A3E31]|uniref:hypothetical protein n=1 Tax=Winogradskyella sp. A3E31 TaxID=3349637 RepID=UPI00398B27B2
MQEDYFGITSLTEMHSFSSPKDFVDMLIDKGAYVRKKVISLNENKVKDSLESSRDMKESIFKFIVSTYINLIDSKIYNRACPLESKCYGLTSKKQKQIALNEFNSIYNELELDSINLTKKTKSESGIMRYGATSKLKIIKYALEGEKSNISNNQELVFEYLTGNKEYFDFNLLKEDQTLSRFLDRYSKFQFLIQLNDTYKFEPDWYFSTDAKIREAHKKYSEIIPNEIIFIHTYRKISQFKTDKIASTNSLYCTLFNLGYLDDSSHKLFKKFILAEFNISISKILNPDSHINDSHQQRISKFSKEFEDLDV